MEPKNKDLDLQEWESLFRHPNFEKVTELIENRVEGIQLNVQNRAKMRMNMDSAVESAGDLRVMAELTKVLQHFKSLRMQILQRKGVN